MKNFVHISLLTLLCLPLFAEDVQHPAVFDGSPKRFFFMHSSHQGMSEFEYVVEKLARQKGHTFTRYQGPQPIAWDERRQKWKMGKAMKSLMPQGDNDKVVFIWQDEGYPWWRLYQQLMLDGKDEATARKEADRKAADDFLAKYKKYKEIGISNIFFLGYHYHPSNFRGKEFEKAIFPAPHAKDFAGTREWMNIVNEELGRTVCFDGRAVTFPYWPYTIGADGRHGGKLHKYLRFENWLETVSKEEGNPIEIDIDYEALLDEAKKKRHVIQDVIVTGDLRVGGKAVITWKADPSVDTVQIICMTQGGRYEYATYVAGPKSTSPSVYVAQNIDAKLGRYEWSIPAQQHGVRDPKKKNRQIQIPTQFARFMVEAGSGNNVPGFAGSNIVGIKAE